MYGSWEMLRRAMVGLRNESAADVRESDVEAEQVVDSSRMYALCFGRGWIARLARSEGHRRQRRSGLCPPTIPAVMSRGESISLPLTACTRLCFVRRHPTSISPDQLSVHVRCVWLRLLDTRCNIGRQHTSLDHRAIIITMITSSQCQALTKE